MDYLIVQHNQIKKWKTTILEIVKYGFIKNISADVQDSVGIWKNAGDAMPFIRDNNQSVLVDEGVLSFSIIINEETILYSLWLQAGEIRIGFKVPNNLIQANKTQIEQKLANLYNGKPCERINRDKDAVFFDWIFSDQFASFDTMQKSFIEVQSEVDFKPTTILIANKIYDMLTHIFIASANGIIDVTLHQNDTVE